MIKAVLFDFWGTLIENGIFPSPVRQVRYLLKLDMPFKDYITKFERVFMTKKYKDLTEAFTTTCKEFGVKPDKKLVDELVGMWNKNTLLCKPFPETIEVLEDLKKDYKLGLISNTCNFSTKQVIEKYKLAKYFDAIVLSVDEGCLKTDKELFEKVLKDLKVKPEEAIMVGDSIQTDIFGARNAGIKSILVDRNGRRNFRFKIKDLTEIKKYLG